MVQVGGVGERTNNLIPNLSEWINGYIKQSDGTLMNATSSKEKISPFIEVNLNDEFTFSYDIGSNEKWAAVAYYDQNKNFIWRSVQYTTTQFTFTINIENAKYIRLSCNTYDNEIYPNLNFGSTNIPYEPYGYKVPVVVSGKNLFDETQVPDKSTSTETSNYQIFKQNGKLIVNGITTSSQVDTEISKENGVNNQALDFINNNAGNYIFTSSVPGRIMIRYKQNGSDVVRYTFNEYNSTNKIADRIVFRLQQNYQYDNETMNIMFKLNKIQSTNYEPYHEPTTTTIYLDEPIEENESISLSDTNVNIPTIRGTNILTVDTTVQPSKVYVKARKESSYEIAMRERYEEAKAQLDALNQESEEE